MKLFIRADASVQIGSGHVMRCLTLAEELSEINANIVRNAGYLKSLVEDRIIGGGERERIDA